MECEVCPWGQELPIDISSLMRTRNLLEMGLSIPVDSLTYWEEEALLIIHSEIASIQKEKSSGPSKNF